MQPRDLIMDPDSEKCEFGALSSVSFEFRAPSGREYCATYRYDGHGNVHDAASFALDHINQWANESEKTPVTAQQVEQDLAAAGLELEGMLRHIITEPRYNVRRKDD